MWPSNFSFRYIPQWIEDRDVNRCLYMHIHRSLIDNNQKWKQLNVQQQMTGYTKHGISIQWNIQLSSVQFSCSVVSNSLRPHESQHPGLPVHHQLPEFTQTHVHRVSDAIQPSQPLSSPSPPAPNPSQHQSLFQWVNSSHEVAKVLKSPGEF